MALNFIKESITIGADKITDKTFTFFKQGFRLNGAIGEPEYRDVTVSGVDVLNLPNAKADGLNYCKLYGKCEQRNLPEGYTEVEYLQSSGTQYIATSVVGNCKVVLDAQGTQTGNTSQVVVGFHSPYGGFFSSYGDTGKWAISPAAGNSQVDYSTRVTARIDFNSSNCTFTIDGVEGSFDVNNSSGLNKNNTFDLFAIRRLQETTRSYFASARIFSCQFYQNNELVCNLIPARRNSDNELGMYDTVTGNFLTNAGTGTFTAGNDIVPTPTQPLDIICNNGVVKVSPNLFDKNTITLNFRLSNLRGYEYGATNDFVSQTGQFVSALIPVEEGATYLKNSITVSAFSRFKTYDANKVAVRINDTNSITIAAGEKYIAFCGYTSEVNSLQVVKGSTLPAYMPYKQVYTDGTIETVQDSLNNTATAEMLLAVNDYKDVQEVLTGNVTRNFAIKVLDGTEEWTYQLEYSRFLTEVGNLKRGVRNIPIACTHYQAITDGREITNVPNNSIYSVFTPSRISIKTNQFTSVDTFTSFLQQQYANGTPVIIVYQLATPTTSTVTAQTLTTKKGTNTIEITQASLTGLPIEVNYMAGVSVTVQQIENENLDNQVTVTIGE